jgi:hypothetical protein
MRSYSLSGRRYIGTALIKKPEERQPRVVGRDVDQLGKSVAPASYPAFR